MFREGRQCLQLGIPAGMPPSQASAWLWGGSPRGVLTGPTCLPRWSTTSLPSLASFCSEVSSWLLETAGEGGSEVQRAPRLWGRWSRG